MGLYPFSESLHRARTSFGSYLLLFVTLCRCPLVKQKALLRCNTVAASSGVQSM